MNNIQKLVILGIIVSILVPTVYAATSSASGKATISNGVGTASSGSGASGGGNMESSSHEASGSSASSSSGAKADNGGTAIANSDSGFPGVGVLPDCNAIAKSTGDFAVKEGCIKTNTMEANIETANSNDANVDISPVIKTNIAQNAFNKTNDMAAVNKTTSNASGEATISNGVGIASSGSSASGGGNMESSSHEASGSSASSSSGARADNGGTAIANSDSGFPGVGVPDRSAIAKPTGDLTKEDRIKINTMEANIETANNSNATNVDISPVINKTNIAQNTFNKTNDIAEINKTTSSLDNIWSLNIIKNILKLLRIS